VFNIKFSIIVFSKDVLKHSFIELHCIDILEMPIIISKKILRRDLGKMLEKKTTKFVHNVIKSILL